MGILLAFAPFLVFVMLERLVGYTTGLSAAAVTSALLVFKDRITGGRLKVLELGTFILFTGLAVYAAINHPTWSIVFVRLLVDAGLLLVDLGSLVLRQPFTLQYAKEQVRPEFWTNSYGGRS